MKKTNIDSISIKNKTVLILGGTGTLGTALTNRYHRDNKIIIFSRNELKQEAMKVNYPDIIYRVGDVKDRDSIKRVLYEFNPEVVVNTAAVKTVWVAQDNPYEAVLTNIIGHQNLIDCIKEKLIKPVESVIFISTDKACNPINVYGQTKAISEQIYVKFAKESTDIKVVLCRYGNVLNSTGSLIPLFQGMIFNEFKSLPITSYEMTRFLLPLEHAIDLIDWAYAHPDSHGRVVVPKLRSIKIIDFINAIIKSTGKKDIKIHKIPIRDGEKLHEEMISTMEFQRVKEFDKYYLIGPERLNESIDHVPYSSEFYTVPKNGVSKFLKELKAL